MSKATSPREGAAGKSTAPVGERAKSPKKKKAKTADAKGGTVSKFVESTPAPRADLGADQRKLTVVYWNCNGLKSTLKNRPEYLTKLAETSKADVICLAETKLQATDVPAVEKDVAAVLPHYRPIWACCTTKKGYSGVVALLRTEILAPMRPQSLGNAAVKVETPEASVESYNIASGHRGVGIPPIKSEYNSEGRVITLNFDKPNIYLVFAYVPNSGDGLKRIRYRIDAWEADMRSFLSELAREKPVAYVGDLNVAHLDSDIWNPTAKHLEKSAGTTKEERETMGRLLDAGFVDGFRHFHPEAAGHFTYWSVRARNLQHNRGLRLDYTLVSEGMVKGESPEQLGDAFILKDVCAPHGDHCAVGMAIKY